MIALIAYFAALKDIDFGLNAPMVLIADLNDAIKKAKCAPGTSSSTSDNMAAAVINELIKEAT